MAEIRLGVIMYGVTGRMGTNQHLVRSILEIRRQGGVRSRLSGGRPTSGHLSQPPSRGGLCLSGRGGPVDSIEDPAVAGAAAEVAGDGLAYREIVGLGIVIE